MRIRCNRFDEAAGYQIEDHHWLHRPDGELKRFIPQQVSPPIPGEGVVQTEIIDLRRAINLKRLAREISWRYRPALEGGILKLSIGRQSVEPAALPADDRHSFSRPVEIGTDVVIIAGWVGTAPSGFDGRGGIRCSAFGRSSSSTSTSGTGQAVSRPR